MGIVAAYAVPHPPLIVPAVGKGEQRAIQNTIDAYEEVARRIAAHRPDTIVITSPHAPFYRDCFFVAQGCSSAGDMSRFGVFDGAISVDNDEEVASEIIRCARERGIPVASDAGYSSDLDHATYVPLHFIQPQWLSFRLVRLGLSLLPAETHRQLGAAIAHCIESLGRRCVLVASGDLSHKLKADGSYGFAPEGPRFDDEICRIFADGQLDDLFGMDEGMCDAAAECGLRSFQVMAGALQGSQHTQELLSYEGPFGVGYGIAAFEVEGACHAVRG